MMRATEKWCYAALLLQFIVTTVEAQPAPPRDSNVYQYGNFSPPVAVIIGVLIAAFFFMAFFSIYIRHCSDSSGSAVGRALTMRSWRRAAARGLDASVIENFPTFSYSEVKHHQIGKGALECAVCLNEFEEDESLRLLPKCDHVFHPECIDAWLQSHVTCPVCRANLAPQAGDDEPGPIPVSTSNDAGDEMIIENDVVRSDEVVVQVDEGRSRTVSRNTSFENPNRPQRQWSIGVLGFGKFRSHSTGHSLVQPGENVDRFTLRLPEVVRKEVMDRARLNRTRSFATGLSSSRRGFRTGGEEEGSNRVGRIYQRIELTGSEVQSDRWGFFTRGLSFRSPRVRKETGEGSGSGSKRVGSRTPAKMPSFKCLEPKADVEDENRRLSGPPPV